jgi:hypothetical protein
MSRQPLTQVSRRAVDQRKRMLSPGPVELSDWRDRRFRTARLRFSRSAADVLVADGDAEVAAALGAGLAWSALAGSAVPAGGFPAAADEPVAA